MNISILPVALLVLLLNDTSSALPAVGEPTRNISVSTSVTSLSVKMSSSSSASSVSSSVSQSAPARPANNEQTTTTTAVPASTNPIVPTETNRELERDSATDQRLEAEKTDDQPTLAPTLIEDVPTQNKHDGHSSGSIPKFPIAAILATLLILIAF